MKTIFPILAALCAAFASADAGTVSHHDSVIDGLWSEFVNPPDSTRTKVWWFHGETESTREGIEADLREFKEKGVGGVVYYDQVHGKGEGAAPSMSPGWWDLLKHAAITADGLGLSFEVAVGNGYVTGGPWITPDLAMKKVVYADTLLTVGSGSEQITVDAVTLPHFRDIATLMFPDDVEYQPLSPLDGPVVIAATDTVVALPLPAAVTLCGVSYTLTPRGKGSTGSMNIPGKPQERYFGAGYVDYPPVGQLECSDDGVSWRKVSDLLPVENNIGHKSRRRTISFPAVTGRYFRLHIHDWTGGDTRYGSITLGDLVLYRRDIVDNVEAQTGLRTEVTYPAPVGGDKGAVMSETILDVTDSIRPDGTLSLTLPAGTWRIMRFGYIPTGARTKHGRRNLLGYEADVMSAKAANVHYDNYFKQIRDTLASIGVPPVGMCMDSHEAGTQNWTQHFERRFVSRHGYDLIPWLPAFAGYIVDSRVATDGVLRDFRRTVAETIASEYYGTFAARCRRDSVCYTSQAMLNIETDNIDGRGAAMKPQGEFWAYQKNGNYDCLDAASAAHIYGHGIASGEAFTDTPYDATFPELLRIANIAYCRGINEFVICASTHQPWLDRKYDDSASAHPYVFHRFHPEWEMSADFWDYQARCANLMRKGHPVVDLCVYLGEEPPLKTIAYCLPVMPEGYNFDVCTYPSLMHRMTAAGSELKVEGGMTYKALVIPGRTYISPEVEARIGELVRNGLTVVRCDKGEDVARRLEESGLTPDIDIRSADLPDDKVMFFHRAMDGADIYFVYNHSPHGFSQPVMLRTVHDNVSLWDPAGVSSTQAARKPDGRIDLNLAPWQSTFIICASSE